MNESSPLRAPARHHPVVDAVLFLFVGVFAAACSQTLYYDDNRDAADRGEADTDTDTESSTENRREICGAAAGRLFGDDYPWNQAVDNRSLDEESDAMIAYLSTVEPWTGVFVMAGADGGDKASYGMTTLIAGDDTEKELFEIRESAFWSPHCDHVSVPIPPVGAVEGEEGYECENDGDCHLVVLDSDNCLLYEMYRVDKTDERFLGGCLALWDLTAPYDARLRGDCCTSAEAAGLPIAPLMFSADDVASGEIPHAIRFALPSTYIRDSVYVRPATHTSTETSGGSDAPPRGARLRLRRAFDDGDLTQGSRVITAALKKYGMILTDPGDTTFTVEDDRFTTRTWAEVGLHSGSLAALKWTDFEVVEGGERFLFDGDCHCERHPITE